jgi:hypothetical protein
MITKCSSLDTLNIHKFNRGKMKSRSKLKYLLQSWQLQGADKLRAQARFNLEGYELDVALLNIDHQDKTTPVYKQAALEIEYKFNKLTQNEYEKQKATLEERPFFKVITGEYRQTGPQEGTMVFELDWNDYFVEELTQNGWTGYSADQMVDKWFEDACKQMFDEEALAPLEAEPQITSYNRTRKRPVANDKNEYS